MRHRIERHSEQFLSRILCILALRSNNMVRLIQRLRFLHPPLMSAQSEPIAVWQMQVVITWSVLLHMIMLSTFEFTKQGLQPAVNLTYLVKCHKAVALPDDKFKQQLRACMTSIDNISRGCVLTVLGLSRPLFIQAGVQMFIALLVIAFSLHFINPDVGHWLAWWVFSLALFFSCRVISIHYKLLSTLSLFFKDFLLQQILPEREICKHSAFSFLNKLILNNEYSTSNSLSLD